MTRTRQWFHRAPMVLNSGCLAFYRGFAGLEIGGFGLAGFCSSSPPNCWRGETELVMASPGYTLKPCFSPSLSGY